MQRWTVKAALFGLFAAYIIIIMINWPADDGGPDAADTTISKLMMVLGAAIFFGFLAVIYIIPFVGDLMSTFFYSSGEIMETDENMRGSILMAQGNYEAAIAEFERNAEKDPTSRFPVTEMAKIYDEKLGDPASAIQVLHDALEREWEPDDAAFILFKLADIQADSLADFDGARETLAVVQEQLPETRHAANATHKLKEIDEKEIVAQQRIARGESAIPVDDEPKLDPKEEARLQREREEQEFLERIQNQQKGGPGDAGGEGGARGA